MIETTTPIRINIEKARDYFLTNGYNMSAIKTEEDIVTMIFWELDRFGITPVEPITEPVNPRASKESFANPFPDFLQELRRRITFCRAKMADDFSEWGPRLDEARNFSHLAENAPQTKSGCEELKKIIKEQIQLYERKSNTPLSRVSELIVLNEITERYQKYFSERKLSVFNPIETIEQEKE